MHVGTFAYPPQKPNCRISLRPCIAYQYGKPGASQTKVHHPPYLPCTAEVLNHPKHPKKKKKKRMKKTNGGKNTRYDDAWKVTLLPVRIITLESMSDLR